MAQLTITALDDAGDPVAVGVQLYLSDANGNAVRAFTSSGILVQGVTATTAADGTLTLDLPANSDVTTPNTYYTVRVGSRAPVLIQKTSSTQTLAAATVATGSALGTAATLDSLADVTMGTPLNGDYLRYDVDHWEEQRPPGPGVSGLVSDPLRSARAAWGAGLLSWLALGDSNTEGFYASSIALRYLDIAKRALESGVAGSAAVGYVPRHSLTNYGYTWTTNGALTEFGTSGLGYAATGPAANGGYIETTQTCNRFWIRYTAGTLIGQFTVSIDGGAGVVVPAVVGTIAGGFTWDSGPLSTAAHTVRITSSDAVFPSRIEGVMFFNGNGNSSGAQGSLTAGNALTGTGVRVWNGAKFGTKAITFAAASATTWWTDGLDKIAPRLVTMMFGTNEINAGDVATTMRTNIVAIIDRINTVMDAAVQPRPSYVLIVPHGTGALSTTADAYALAIRNAANDRGCAVFDMREVTGFVGTSAADTYGYTATADGATRLHLSDAGHRVLGQLLADYLLRAFGGVKV